MRVHTLFAATLLAIWANVAHATLLEDGSVVWNFEGQGQFAINNPGHPQPYTVTGSLSFDPIGGPLNDVTLQISALLDGAITLSGYIGFVSTLNDNPYLASGYVADGLSSGSVGYPPGYPSSVSGPPEFTPAPAGFPPVWYIALVDNDGTWLQGIPGQVLPPGPAPDATLFETRNLVIEYFQCVTLPGPNGACGATTQGIPWFNITITSFSDPLPEANLAALSLLALVSLGIRRTLAR